MDDLPNNKEASQAPIRSETEAMSLLSSIEQSLSTIRGDLGAIQDTKAMASLIEDLDALQKYTGATKRSVQRWFKFSKLKEPLSVVLSLGAVIISLYSFSLAFFGSPEVRVLGGRDFEITYDPQSDVLMLDLRTVLANYGRKMDVINLVQGSLSWDPAGKVQPIIFDSGNLKLGTASGELVAPFTIRDNSAIEMRVQAARKLGPAAHDRFFDVSTLPTSDILRKSELALHFRTETGAEPSVNLCFEYTKDVLLSLSQVKSIPQSFSKCSR